MDNESQLKLRAGVRSASSFETAVEWPTSEEIVVPAERSAAGVQTMARAKAPNGEAYHIRFTMSTEEVATDGIIIVAEGWKTDRFKRNPVFLWAHDYRTAPIGRVVDVQVKGRKLVGWVLFDEEDPEAVRVLGKYERKMMAAVSVGFIPEKVRFAFADELSKDEIKKGAWAVSDSTVLLELSAVPVPADSGATEFSASGAEERAAPEAETETTTPEAGSDVREPALTDVNPLEGSDPVQADESRGELTADAIERLARMELLARKLARAA